MASTQSPYFISQQQQPPYSTPPQDHSFNFNTRVSPSILLIIVILAVIFFVSGLLHLLVRFLLRPGAHNRSRARDDDAESVSALQGQLQQLFHLHDAGVDQSFIDSLPVFPFSSVAAANAANAFDCAVCLCEFEPPDTLRLLPRCSHAFHTECIDTWLLSHSTCPLCRSSLLSSPGGSYSPIVLVTTENFAPAPENEENPTSLRDLISEEKESVVTVKLGKFTSLDDRGEASSSSVSVSISASNSIGSRRCFSMGSFAYVMDETSDLRVPVRTMSKRSLAGPKNRAAVSECGCESKREFEFNAEISKKESFSISKIWARGNGGRVDGSRRAFSFRFQRNLQGNNGNATSGEDPKGKDSEFPRRTVSEIDVARRGNDGVEAGLEEESQSCNSLDSQSNPPSFARKTLLWLMGRQQNKVDPNHP